MRQIRDIAGVKFQKAKIFLKDHWMMLIKSSAENHLRIQECKSIKEGQTCNLNFGSYSELKRYQKKVRLFTYSFSSTAVSILVAIIAIQMFFGAGSSQGATYSWTQSEWLITKIGANTGHTTSGPPSDFKDYVSKDSEIAAVDVPLLSDYGRKIELTPQTAPTVTQTSDTDFNAGTKVQTSVVGTGDTSVSLTKGFIKIDGSSGGSEDAVLALKYDGTIWAWGSNTYGQLGNGDTTQRFIPMQVRNSSNTGPLSNVVDVAIGRWHSLAVDATGNVWAWGDNSNYQLGDGSITQRNLPVKVQKTGGGDFTNAKAVSAGNNYSMILDNDGKVWVWGYNYTNLSLGLGAVGNINVPTQITSLPVITSISSQKNGNYSYTNFAIAANGQLWGWGINSLGSIFGSGSTSASTIPVLCYGGIITGTTTVKAVASGGYHSAILTNVGDVFVSGAGTSGMNGDGTINARNTPYQVPGMSNVAMISHGANFVIALKTNGEIWAWGANTGYQLGNGTNVSATSPVRATTVTDNNNILIGAEGSSSFAMKTDGSVVGWGQNTSGVVGGGDDIVQKNPVNLTVFNNNYVSGAVKMGNAFGNSWFVTGGKLYIWGRNDAGQLGNGSNVATTAVLPKQVSGLNNVTDATMSKAGRYVNENSSFAIDSGQLWAWGSDVFGKLGDDATLATKSTPTLISSLGNNVSKVSASAQHVLALKSDGTVWAWGRNSTGQLGKGFADNLVTANYVPAQVGGALTGKNIVSVEAGGDTYYAYSLALDNLGNLYSWGSGRNGVLGSGADTDTFSPTLVTGISNVVAISAGSSHVLALKNDGTVWAWGENIYNQLGDGTNPAVVYERNSPVQITKINAGACAGSLSGICTNTSGTVTKVSAGAYASSFVASDGKVYVWGLNAYGQLGFGNYSNVSSPTVNNALQGAVDVQIGGNNYSSASQIALLARKNDGTVFGAGYGVYGQIGDGTIVTNPSVTQVWGATPGGFNLGLVYLPGTFTSSTIDLGPINLVRKAIDGSLKLKWTRTLNTLSEESIQFQVSSDVGVGGLANFYGVDGNVHADCNTPGTCYSYNELGTVLHPQHDGASHLKYKAFLKTADQTKTPLLDSVSFDYNYYSTGKSLISSAYDSGMFGNVMNNFGWKLAGDLPAGTNVGMSIKTAKSVSDLASATWSTPVYQGDSACSYDSGTKISTCNSLSLPLRMTTAGDQIDNNQYFQYKLILDSDGKSTPSVEEAFTKYIVNAAPQLALTTAPLQKFKPDVDAGKVDIDYTIQNGGTGGNSEAGDIFQTAVFYTSQNGAGLKLTSGIDNDDSSLGISGTDGQYLPSAGYVQIDKEVIKYNSKTGANGSWTLSGLTRGTWPTTDPGWNSVASSHNANSVVYASLSDASISTVQTSSEIGVGNLKNGAGNILAGDISQQYLLRWRPQDDTNFGQRYDQNIILRITSNDKNQANQIGSVDSSSFIVDTKKPVIDGISVNLQDETISINRPGEDSAYDIYFTTGGGFSATPDIPDAQALPWLEPFSYPPGYQIPPPQPGNDPQYHNFDYWHYIFGEPAGLSFVSDIATSGTVSMRVTDNYGNISNPYSYVVPITPENVIFFDVSNSSENIFSEFITWKPITDSNLKYRVCSSTADEDGNTPAPEDVVYGSCKTISDVSTNYYIDENLDPTQHYYYRIYTENRSDGSVSNISNFVQDTPDGNGRSDTTPPTLSLVSILPADVTATSVKVNWEANETSNSGMGYTTEDEYNSTAPNGQYAQEKVNLNSEIVVKPANANGLHSYTLTGLEPDTTYYLRPRSSDIFDNEGSIGNFPNNSIITVRTKDGPKIERFTIKETTNNSVTITWSTTTASNSHIYYSSQEPSNGALLIADENVPNDSSGVIRDAENYVKIHEIKIPNLKVGEKYYFYLRSESEGGNYAIENNAGKFYEFTTDSDLVDPVITLDEISQPTLKTNSKAVIQWSTDKPTTTEIDYKRKTDSTWIPYPYSVNLLSKGHSAMLTGLESYTWYDYRVKAVDINGNDDSAGPFEFQTARDPAEDHDPLEDGDIIFSDKNPSPLIDTDAVINFTTKQIATCILNHWDTAFPELPRLPISEDENSYNINHAMHIPELTASKTYGYEIFCNDNIKDDNGEYVRISSGKKEFTTTEKLYTESGAGALGDKLPPVINNVKVVSTSGENAVITWDTDEKANSSVRYGVVGIEESSASDSAVNYDKNNFAITHTVTVNGLIPGTKYVFVATSTDASGNIGQSAESSFTTASPSSLSSIKAESLNLGEAVITWNTSSETTSTVEYGLTTSYGEKKESNTQTKEHSINLSSLNQGVTYHFRVKGKDADGKLYSSSDQTFEPKSPPQIKDISNNSITEHEATVSFQTNVPTTATVEYVNISDPSDNGSQSDNEMGTKHSIQIKNLSQGSTFKIKIKARDEQGTESSQDAKDLTTGKDENPPKIDMVKTDLALAQNDKVQAIISWTTDEQATTSVIYKEGRNAEPKEIKVSDALTPAHIAVITAFKPGTVYYFNTKSTDASGNTALSTDYALLTPKRKENIIQIIIGNFTDIFGWAKF